MTAKPRVAVNDRKLKSFAFVLSAFVVAFPVCAEIVAPMKADSTQALSAEIQALDAAMFDAFNTCSDPGQLAVHASYFSPDVEFYHDTGGVTWTRDDMIANTRKYACGNYTRELVAGTLQVYPIKDFGAISRGVHRFCATDTGKCDGIADFVLVWRHQDGQWQITRSLSFGHRPNK